MVTKKNINNKNSDLDSGFFPTTEFGLDRFCRGEDLILPPGTPNNLDSDRQTFRGGSGANGRSRRYRPRLRRPCRVVERPADPVVLTGAALPSLQGTAPSKLLAWPTTPADSSS